MAQGRDLAPFFLRFEPLSEIKPPSKWTQNFTKFWAFSLEFTKFVFLDHYSQEQIFLTVHTVSFDWFLSGLEWIINLETSDILSEIIIEYQI